MNAIKGRAQSMNNIFTHSLIESLPKFVRCVQTIITGNSWTSIKCTRVESIKQIVWINSRYDNGVSRAVPRHVAPFNFFFCLAPEPSSDKQTEWSCNELWRRYCTPTTLLSESMWDSIFADAESMWTRRPGKCRIL